MTSACLLEIFYRFHILLQVIRHYHGHLSAVYAMDLHPTIDVLVTSGRDSTARVSAMVAFAVEVSHMRKLPILV